MVMPIKNKIKSRILSLRYFFKGMPNQHYVTSNGRSSLPLQLSILSRRYHMNDSELETITDAIDHLHKANHFARLTIPYVWEAMRQCTDSKERGKIAKVIMDWDKCEW